MTRKSLGPILGIVLLLAAAGAAWWLLRTAPVPETREPSRTAKIVQTLALRPAKQEIAVSANGTVIPSRRLVVRPEITGRIVSQHPSLVPGGRIAAGEQLFTIDAADYQLAVREARTALAEAGAEEDLEAGRQTIARRELEQLRKDLPESAINQALVLREPFKARAEALLERAAAALEKAELDISRTEVAAPFDALVIEESVESGQLADSGTPLATLVGAEAFWIQASVPVSDLRWVQLPDGDTPGAAATVELAGTPFVWQGRVVRLLGDLEEAGRLARVLVEVPQPLDANPDQPLLLGSYVRVKIDAGTLDDVVEIPRPALREGNRVWLAGPDDTLLIRDVELLWRRENSVLVRDFLQPGESLIVSELTAALPGMAVTPEPVKVTAPD